MLDLKILHTPEEIHQIQPLWDQLQSRIEQSTVFQSWDWCFSWIETFYNPEKHKLAVACCYAQDKLVMIFPFTGEKKEEHYFFSTIGYELADYSDVLVLPGYEKLFSNFFRKFFRSLSAEQIILRFIPSWSVFNQILKSWNPFWINRITENLEYKEEIFSIINLPKTWEEYKNTLSKKNLKNIRRALHQMEKTNLTAQFSQMLSEKEIETVIQFHCDTLFKNHQIISSFQDSQNKRFLISFMKKIFPKDQIVLFMLKDNKKLVQIDLQFSNGKYWVGYMTGMHPDYKEISPGRTAMYHVINKAIEEGVDVYDFGWGNENYKSQWATEDSYPRSVIIHKNPSPQTVILALRNKVQLRTRLRKLFKPSKNN